MWVEVTNQDEVIHHLNAGEQFCGSYISDGVVIHACDDSQVNILTTLSSITNERLTVKLITEIPFNKLTPIIKKYIDVYENLITRVVCVKREVWENVRSN